MELRTLVNIQFLCEDYQNSQLLEDFEEHVEACPILMLHHFKTRDQAFTKWNRMMQKKRP